VVWEVGLRRRDGSESRKLLSIIDPIKLRSLDALFGYDEETICALDLHPTRSSGEPLESYVERVVANQTQTSTQNVMRNIDAIIEGIRCVMDPQALLLFTPAEINAVLCGHPTGGPLFTEDELRAHVVGAHGYTQSSPEVKSFIRIVSQFTPEQQSHFIEFLTGSPRLPLGGLAGLRRPITVVKKEGKELPSCSTCFLFLKLPSYGSESILRAQLLLAISEGRKHFSMS
jgi:hypothetical protein